MQHAGLDIVTGQLLIWTYLPGAIQWTVKAAGRSGDHTKKDQKLA